jgi:conjugal transfer ATP-binding protein TraC
MHAEPTAERLRLAPFLPYENGVEAAGLPHALALRDGGIGFAFNVGVPAVEAVPGGRGLVAEAIDGLVRALPPGYVLQVFRRNLSCIDGALRLFEERAGGVGSILAPLARQHAERFRAAQRDGFFPGQPAINFYPTTEDLVFAVRTPPCRALSPVGGGREAARRDELLRSTVRALSQGLRAAGLGVSLMSAAQIAGYAAGLLNPALATRARPYQPDVTADDASEAVAAMVDLRPEPEHGWHRGFISADSGVERYFRVVSMMWQPSAMSDGMLDDLFQPLRDLTVVATFKALEQGAARLAMKSKRFVNTRMRLPWNAEELESINESIGESIARNFEGERYVLFRLQAVLHERSADAAEDAAAFVANGLATGYDVPALVEQDIGGSLILQGCLPFTTTANAERSFARQRRMMSHDAAGLAFASGTWAGVPRDVNTLYVNRWGRPLMVSTYQAETNANFLLSGGSGGGKSFWVHDLAVQELRIPSSRMYLTSIKADYKKLALAYGRYVELDLDGVHSINPFSGPPTAANVEFWTEVLTAMVVDGSSANHVTREERLLLADAAKLAAEDTLLRYHGARETLLGHVVEKLAGFEGRMGSQLAQRFRDYYGEGKYARLFDRPSTLSLEDRLVFFNLRLVASMSCANAVMLSIFRFVDGVMTDPQLTGVPKTLLVDEGWSSQRDDFSARLVERAARIYRSFGGRFGAVSQSFEDFDTPFGRALLANTATKIVLPQEASSLAKIRNYIALNDAEFELVRSLRMVKGAYGEFFMRIEGKGATVGRVVPDALRYAVATTDPQDVAVIEDFVVQADGRWDRALERFAREFPAGVSARRRLEPAETAAAAVA